MMAALPSAAGSTVLAQSPVQFDGPTVAEAHAEVVRSDAAFAAAAAARDAARSDLDDLSAGSAELVEQIASTRSDLRDHAVSAYMSEEPNEDLMVMLGGADKYDASAKSNLFRQQAHQSTETVDRYATLKAQVDPELLRRGNELQQLEQSVIEAQDAVLGARANEAEAERQEQLREIAAEQARALAERQRAETAARSTTLAPTTAAPAAAFAADELTSVDAPDAPPAPTASATPAPVPAPAPPTTTAPVLPAPPKGGPSEGQWAKLRNCESGGNYQAVSKSGKYRGAYQYDYRTWAGLGGAGDPAAASPPEQDSRAKLLYSQRGWRPWPVCGRFLQ